MDPSKRTKEALLGKLLGSSLFFHTLGGGGGGACHIDRPGARAHVHCLLEEAPYQDLWEWTAEHMSPRAHVCLCRSLDTMVQG